MGDPEDALTLKITVIGESSVGKTSIIKRFVGDTFDENYSATIGFSFLSRTITYQDRSFTLNVWDTSGQERYRSLAQTYYRGSDACILVYDVSMPKTLEPLSYWYDEFTSLVRPSVGTGDVPLLLVGNKADLKYEGATVAEARQFAIAHNIPDHLLVSAREGTNVDGAFLKLLDRCIERWNSENHMAVPLGPPKPAQRTSRDCC
jgi:small GTP-binding protein